MAFVRIAAKKYMEFGNDTKKVFSKTDKSKFRSYRWLLVPGRKGRATKVHSGCSS
jgi:hypothetical protein